MKKKSHSFPLPALAGVLLLADTARRCCAAYMTRVAIDRKLPPHPTSARRRITGSMADPALLQKAEEAGNALAALPHETVHLVAPDGTDLAAHWFCRSHPQRVIIAMHGWRSSWNRDLGPIFPFLQNSACSVLFPEQRGQGQSGGAYLSFGALEHQDCLLWADWVMVQCGPSIPCYLYGVSMGASTVLLAGGCPLPPNVHGIISDCGYTSPAAIGDHVARNNLHYSKLLWHRSATRRCRRKLHIDMETVSCPEALKKCTIPVLFIHGSDDRFVPVGMAYENFSACASPKRLLIVPGAAHAMSDLTDPAGYRAALTAFWAEFDNRCPL